LFIKGTRIRAELIYRAHINAEEPRTAKELAADYSLPLPLFSKRSSTANRIRQRSRLIFRGKKPSWRPQDSRIRTISTIRTESERNSSVQIGKFPVISDLPGT